MVCKSLIAAASLLAIAVPAAGAADPPPGVPAGHIQQYAKEIVIHNSHGTSDQIVVTNLSSDSSREVSNEAAGGKLVYETTTSPRVMKHFDASRNTLTLDDGWATPPFQTLDQEAASFRVGVDDGCFEQTAQNSESTTYELRPIGLPCADSTTARLKVVVSNADGHVIQRISTDTASDFFQSESLAYANDYPLRGHHDLLRMSPHPGAKVIDNR
jgi:hypothetical protein